MNVVLFSVLHMMVWMNYASQVKGFVSKPHLCSTEKFGRLFHSNNYDNIENGAETKSRNLVFIGGGHAHLQAIKAFNKNSRPKNLHVTLIDVQPFASYSGMVPGCIAKIYRKEETQIDLVALAEWAEVNFILDAVTSIDPCSQQISLLKSKIRVPYDVVSIDIGSASKGLNSIPGVKDFAIPTRPIAKLIDRIEKAEEKLQKNTKTEKEVKVAIVGGGVAGIELAMTIRERWASLASSFEVTILNSGPGILSNESSWCREVLHSTLKMKQIQIKNECRVDRVDKGSIYLSDGTIIPFTHCLWATGAEAHPLAYELELQGIDINENGWIRVKDSLQCFNFPNIFAAGDCASIESPNFDTPLKAGVYAVRAGPVLIENISLFLKNGNFDLAQYTPQEDFMKLIACGDETAIGFRFGIPLQGKWVWQLKDKIDRMFMKLFHVKNFAASSSEGNQMNTSQYDERYKRSELLLPEQGAELLLRTDDEVDFEKAWDVIRDMMEDESYKENVLFATKKFTPNTQHSNRGDFINISRE